MGGLGIRLERAAEGKKNDVMGCAHSPFPPPFPIRVFPTHCLSFLVVIKTWRISSFPQPTYENQAHEHVLDEGGIDEVPEPAPVGQQEMDERRAGPQGIAQPGPELGCKQREDSDWAPSSPDPREGRKGQGLGWRLKTQGGTLGRRPCMGSGMGPRKGTRPGMCWCGGGGG